MCGFERPLTGFGHRLAVRPADLAVSALFSSRCIVLFWQAACLIIRKICATCLQVIIVNNQGRSNDRSGSGF
jgi:hypothetical protein